jgi:cephalosporin hydroxylase
MKALLKKIVGEQITDFISKQLVSRKIKTAIREARKVSTWNPETALDFLSSKVAREISPWQYRKEIIGLAAELQARRPKVIVEVGTAAGGTLFLAASFAADDALLISVDLPQGLFGGGYPDWKMPLYKSFARPGQRIELIRDDSHAPHVLQQVKDLLAGRTIDYLFLDGDHSYEGVKEDFEKFLPLVSKDGLVAFHDIAKDRSPQPDHFVSDFWNEIKQDYEHRELIQDPNQSKCGLGLLFIANPVMATKLV